MRLPDLDLRLYLPKPPFWLVAFVLVSLVASWIPLAMIAKHRVSKHPEPRYHIFLDMDNQAKLEAQGGSELFADGRAMRPRVPGTIARGGLRESDDFYRGYTVAGQGEDASTTYIEGYPAQVELTRGLLEHGRLQYDVFCTPCHGASGDGQGTVQLRVMKLMTRGNTGTAWTQVANLHQGTFQEDAYPNGKLYNTIMNGKGAMNGYGDKIAAPEAWAIVAYVRALQMTQPANDTPEQAEVGENEPVALGD